MIGSGVVASSDGVQLANSSAPQIDDRATLITAMMAFPLNGPSYVGMVPTAAMGH